MTDRKSKTLREKKSLSFALQPDKKLEEEASISKDRKTYMRQSSMEFFLSSTDSVSEETQKRGVIPCIYMPFDQGSSKVLIYFHGNAEDIGLASELLDYVRVFLRVSFKRSFNYRLM